MAIFGPIFRVKRFIIGLCICEICICVRIERVIFANNNDNDTMLAG